MVKIEEMERMLREAQAEKNRLLEHRVGVNVLRCLQNHTERQYIHVLFLIGARDGVEETGSGRREEEKGGLGEETSGRDEQTTETGGERGEATGDSGERGRGRERFELNVCIIC